MDFFNHIAYSEHPSQVCFANISATFPPLIYLGILFAGLYECIRCALCMDGRSEWLARFLFLAMVFAYPFFCTVERGNSCLIVLVLLLTAVQWRADVRSTRRLFYLCGSWCFPPCTYCEMLCGGFNISIFGSYLLSAAGLLYGIWTALPRPSHK